MTPILFADFLDTLGWGCLLFFFLAYWALNSAVSAIGSLFQSDEAKDVAKDVAGEVAKSWLKSWFED
jgi:hypothetical protein